MIIKLLVNTHQIATIYSLSPYPAHKNAKSKPSTMSAIYPNRTMQNDPLFLLIIFPVRPPRLTRLSRIITMLIRTNQLLLINATMDLPITSGKPSQSIRLPNTPQSLHHLMIIHFLRTHKIIEHLTLVDKRQDRGNGIWLAREERVASAPIDDSCYKA